MHSACSNDIKLPDVADCRSQDAQAANDLDTALSAVQPDMLGMRLVVGSHGLAAQMVRLLAERGREDVEVIVADAPMPSSRSQYGGYEWTPEMTAAKKLAWDAQQPRHSSAYTKPQTTIKARKAARKRAKAGRKASR